MCPFTYQKCPFMFQNCPSIFQNDPFIFQNCPFIFQNCPIIFHYDPFLFQNYFLLPGIAVLFSRGVILILKNVLLFFKIALYFSRSAFFLLTVLPYFQECFFTSWLYLLVLLRAVQRDSICLVLVLFPFKIDLLVMTCILLEFIFTQKTSFNPPVDIIMSYFIDFESVNSIWYKFKQGLHAFEKTVVLEISREQKNWLLHYCRNQVICYFSKYLKN